MKIKWTSIVGLTSMACWALTSNAQAISIPNYPAFTIGLSTFFLQPSTTDGDLAYAFIPSKKEVKPNYTWGYGLNLDYVTSMGDESYLGFFHLDTDNRNRTSASSLNPTDFVISSITDFFGMPATSNYTSAKGEAKFNVDQFDAMEGAMFAVSQRLTLDVKGGFRYFDSERDLTNSYIGTIVDQGATFLSGLATADESRYWGIGPEINFNAGYSITEHFKIVSDTSSGVLFGKINDNLAATLNNFLPDNTINVTTQNKFNYEERRVVPNIDEKLGINYAFIYHDQSKLAFELGYQWNEYFNAIDHLRASVDITNFVVQNQAITINNMSHFTSNLSLNGPYLTMSYQTNKI